MSMNALTSEPRFIVGITNCGSSKFQAVEWIMELMATGQLKADEVYSANHFAKVMGISRTPAREALLQLTSEGYFIRGETLQCLIKNGGLMTNGKTI